MARQGSNDPSSGGGEQNEIPLGTPIKLRADEVGAERNTFDDNDEPQVRIKWVTGAGSEGVWIFDRIALWHVRDRPDGSPSKAKGLGAALAGRIAVQVGQFWVDDESWEYGFDGAKQEVAGRFRQGMEVAAELLRRPDGQGIPRLRVSRYLPLSAAAGGQSAAAAPAQPTPTERLSSDGRWRWDGNSWQPIASTSRSSGGGNLI